MAEDTLRLIAKVDDQFSKPLEKLRSDLANTARVPGLDDLRKRFSDIEGTITRLRQTGAQLNSAGGIGGMLGIGNLTGIASVAGLAASMRDLARTQTEMRHFSRETGIAAGHLRELQALGKKFQIDPEAMTGAATGFADKMNDIRRGLGSTYGEIAQKAPQLAKELRATTDNFEALGKVLGWLEKQGNPIDQKRWAQEFDLGPLTRLFTDGPKALRDAWKEVQASGIGKPNPELEKQSKALTDSLTRFDQSVEAMKRTWGPTLLGEMAGAVDRLSTSFGKFAEAWEKLRSGHPLDALRAIDGATDLGLGKGGAAGAIPDGMRGGAAPLMLKQAELQRQIQILEENIARKESVPDPLGEGHAVATDERQKRDRLIDETKKLADEIRRMREDLNKQRDGQAAAQPSAFGGDAPGGLIQKAALRFPGSGGGYSGSGGGTGGSGFGPDGGYGAGGRAFGRLREGDSSLSGGIGPGVGGRSAPTSAQGRENVGSWLDFAQRPADKGGLGLTKEQAHGLVAGMQGESGRNLNPGAFNPNDNGGPSGGTAQWHDGRDSKRFSNLRAFAGRLGKDWHDRGAQQEFLRHEMLGSGDLGGGSERRAYEAIRRAQTRQEALGAHVSKFERPKFPDSEIRKRSSFLYGHGGDEVVDVGDSSGLRLKSAEATAGGDSAGGLTGLLKQIQDGELPGGFDRVTALNDKYHHRANPGSMHTKGLAGDITLRDARRSAEAAEAIRERLRAAGLTDRDFHVKDEYRDPSGHATGGHIHAQFNTPEAAERYRAFTEAQRERERAAAQAAGGQGGERSGDGGMLARARRAGVIGGGGTFGPGGPHGHINGTIELKGFPSHTKADFQGGGIVREVKLNRGSSMSAAEA